METPPVVVPSNVSVTAKKLIKPKKVIIRKKSSKTKYIIISIVVFVILLIIGVVLYFLFIKDSNDSTASSSTSGGSSTSTSTSQITYTILAGDDIMKIANYFYGNGDRTHLLMVADANNLRDPYLIYPGNSLKVNNPTRRRYTYTVVAGDTLPIVAGKVFNDATQSHMLAYQNSNLSAPYTLQAGQILQYFK